MPEQADLFGVYPTGVARGLGCGGDLAEARPIIGERARHRQIKQTIKQTITYLNARLSGMHKSMRNRDESRAACNLLAKAARVSPTA